MKKKTRKITVEGCTYGYLISSKYTDGQSISTLKIFLGEKKSDALLIYFRTWDDPLSGSPLNTGIKLHNKISNLTENYNLNHPRNVRAWILYGIKHGWAGKTQLVIEDGLSALNEMGYETQSLRLRGLDENIHVYLKAKRK
ncbi:hypothetical protein P9597_28770 [Aneurinibacillus migulanus]|uniref:hypothetical protein n=1 Tax=Aneurinibacillus migulanus TaxID=47500 RepID=UPI002E21B192|nr:hypothetical protein [Aneurinibacillus migulanus]